MDKPVENVGFEVIGKVRAHPKAADPRYIEYRRKWAANPAGLIVADFPMHLDIEVTTACNLLCPMCPRTVMIENGRQPTSFFLPFDVYKRIIDEGADNGLYAVNLNLFGEPLLHKQIVEMVDYAHRRGIVDIMFHTNATPLTEKISRGLIQAGLDQLNISLDSCRAERYERLRKGAKFDKVLANIRRFVELREELGSPLPLVRAQMVLMKENADEVEEFQEFWLKIVDSIGIREYRNPLGLESGERVYRKSVDIEGFTCPDPWRRLGINQDGSVWPCCKNNEGDLVVGNIYESSLKDIWHGAKLEAIRKIHREKRAACLKGCRECIS